MDFKQSILDYLIKYTKINTMSDPQSNTTPSTARQMEFAKILMQDMKDIGISNVNLSALGYLTGEIPANNGASGPAIGFIAHMDTSPDFNSTNINPIVHKNYQGGLIELKNGVVIDPAKSPELKKCIGHDIITADGTTLLGTDDKAGIAIIMTMAKNILTNPAIKHGPVKIAFTPDEEIGTGADNFDIKAFGADFAYTIDGDVLGNVENGSFNADSVRLEITGVNTHPGMAKDVMVNPVRVAADLISSWDTAKLPETTEDEQGFIFFNQIEGTAEKVEINGIVREHDLNKLYKLEDELKTLTDKKMKEYKGANIKVSFKEQYRNMKEVLTKNPQAMEHLTAALETVGIKYNLRQVRGGTDGSKLSLMGLPTPNIFAGYSSPHGPYEWGSLQAMEKAFEVITQIAKGK